MNTLAMLAGMLMHEWAATQHLQGSDRQIILADAHRFGVEHKVALAEYLRGIASSRRMADEVKSWNHPDVFGEWERETAWRIRCWCVLEDALNPEYGSWNLYGYYDEGERWGFARCVAARLEKLYELRGLIGEDAFAAGVMPAPIPHYRR